MQMTGTRLALTLGIVSAIVGAAWQIAEFGVPAKSTDLRETKFEMKGMVKSLAAVDRRIQHADRERQELYTQQAVNNQRFKSINNSIGKIEASQITIIELLRRRVN